MALEAWVKAEEEAAGMALARAEGRGERRVATGLVFALEAAVEAAKEMKAKVAMARLEQRSAHRAQAAPLALRPSIPRCSM